MTKTEKATLRARIADYKEQLQDPTCRKFPLARAHVQAAISATRAQIRAGR